MVIIKVSKAKVCIGIMLLLVLLIKFIFVTYIYNFKYNKVKGYAKHTVMVIDKYSQNDESITYLIALKDKNLEKFKDRFLLKLKDINSVYSYGDVLEVYGYISLPKTLGNEGEFNYKNYLNSKKIIGNMYTKSCDYVENITGNMFFRYIKRYKEYVSTKLLQYLDENNAGVIMGMVYGDTEHISVETKENFEKIGISHLTAVSGSNVATVIMVITYALDKFKLNKYIKNLIKIIFILSFLILCNSELSIMRACIMAICSILFKWKGKKYSVFYSIAISFYIILIINPYAILNVGMQLSFMASLSLILFSELVQKSLKNICKVNSFKQKACDAKMATKFFKFLSKLFGMIIEFLSLTISAQILILPLQIEYFKEYPLSNFLANIVASFLDTPICILGIVSVLFIWLPCISNILVYLTSIFTRLLIFSSDVISSFAYNITFKEQNISVYILYYVLIFCIWLRSTNFFAKRIKKISKLKYRCSIAIVFLILILVTTFTNIFFKEFVYFFNVGQGSMNLVMTRKVSVLVDAGSTNINTAYNALYAFLKNMNRNKVDIIVITHFDADHVNAVPDILKNFDVGKILIPNVPEDSKYYTQILELAKVNNVPYKGVNAGYIENIWGIHIEVLSPGAELITYGESFSNDNSLVCLVNVNETNILFMGDATKYTEEKLLYNEKLLKRKWDIVVIGHHGSNTSTTEEFIQTVNPKIAIISAKKSVYGHPSKTVLEILKKYNIRIYITENLGGIKYMI